MASFLLYAFLLLTSLFTSSLGFFAQKEVAMTPQQPLPSVNHQLSSLLSSLGYQQMATVAHSVLDSTLDAWNVPATIFAPSDVSNDSSSLHFTDHIVPGIFTLSLLINLKPGTLIETFSHGRCLVFNYTSTILVNSEPIVKPDMYINGPLVIHGVRSPISTVSCNPSSTRVAISDEDVNAMQTEDPYIHPSGDSLMRLMLRDAIIRLRGIGYGILALAFRVKFGELATLRNMTVFALDDPAIFSGGHSYVENVRFHVVPNQFLTRADLMRLKLGSVLPTLVRGQRLVVTSSQNEVRINYVPIRSPDVLFNLKIIVHGISVPFPHIPNTGSFGYSFGNDMYHLPIYTVKDDVTGEPCCTASRPPPPGTHPAVDLDDDEGL